MLCGDCSFAAIEDSVRDYDIVQLPHHGKSKQADAIFNKKWDQLDSIYIVSDNTGGSNGGSNNLNTKGIVYLIQKTATTLLSTLSSLAVTPSEERGHSESNAISYFQKQRR